jgi:hypothetical protein
MKTWDEARPGPEKRRAVLEALAQARRNIKQAAQILGLSRTYLSRIVHGRVSGGLDRPITVEEIEWAVNTTTPTTPSTPVNALTPSTRVNWNSPEPLNSPSPPPTLPSRPMSTTASEKVKKETYTVTSMELDLEVYRWLLHKEADRKANGLRKGGIGAVVNELAYHAMAHEAEK